MNHAHDPRPTRTQAPTPGQPVASEQSPGFPPQTSGVQPEGRTEPSFGTAGATQGPSFADSPYAKFDRQTPWYQQSGPLHRNAVSRVMLMAGIFAVGAAVGLGATWWMSKPTEKPPTAAVRKIEPANQARAAKAASGAASAATGHASGISPGELPYDGKSPAADVDAAPPLAVPTEKTDRIETPRTAAAPGASQAKAEPAEPLAPIATPPTTPPKTAAQTLKDVPATAAIELPAAAPPKAQEAKIAKAPPRRRIQQQVAKDKEIERIQQQVDDELKKKSRAGDVTDTARVRTAAEKRLARLADSDPPPASAGGSKRGALARCERDEDSLIGREMCKWKVCKGTWGKNGCPSYERQVSSHY